MNRNKLKTLLESIKNGGISVDAAFEKLRSMPFRDLGFAKVGTHRHIRKGFPEVIYCQGKKTADIKEIFKELAGHGENVLATRAGKEVFSALKGGFKKLKYHEDARIISLTQTPIEHKGSVIVVSAGTSDIPVAEEACVTAEFMGSKVHRLYDVGVAGIHRLLAHTEVLQKANVIIVTAGMEGALPSVVGGLVDKPVIAVPTSIGYGASFAGLTPLLAMLNSCASGVVVVNIDNGFGAGYTAGLINRLAAERNENIIH